MCGGFPGGTGVKNPPANAGDGRDTGLIPESERSPEVENGDPFQYSCLRNPIDEEPSDLWGLQESDITELRCSAHTFRYACVEAEDTPEISVPSSQCCYAPKTAVENTISIIICKSPGKYNLNNNF